MRTCNTERDSEKPFFDGARLVLQSCVGKSEVVSLMAKLFWVPLCLWAMFALCARAQEFRGSLLVEVRDATGGAIPSAKAELADAGSGLAQSVTANSLGLARFQVIPPSVYSLTVKAAGFAAQTEKVTVAIGSRPTVRVTLRP